MHGLFGTISRTVSTTQWKPNTDVYEQHDAFVIRMEIAGVAQKDLHIEASEQALSVFGIRSEPGDLVNDPAPRVFRQAEVEYGPFSRTIPLPPWVDSERIEARYQNGFLVIRIPRAPEPPKKEIEIDVVEE